MEPTHTPRVRVEQVVTCGPITIDNHRIDLENNVWLIGDDDQVLVVDAAHSASEIMASVGGRRVTGIICTHAHRDHINALDELRSVTNAPTYLHPADQQLWHQVVSKRWDIDLADQNSVEVCGVQIKILHTPGHTPGSSCLYIEELETLLSGDTLFPGGPGATRFEYSSFETIMDSITTKLFSLPATTKVLPGHGDTTTIGQESPKRAEWLTRGY